MKVKIQNDLKSDDFIELADALEEKGVDSVTILDGIDYGFVVTKPLVISASDSSYSMVVSIHFRDPIGHVAWAFLGIEDRGLVNDSNNTRWSTTKEIDEKEIEGDLAYASELIEGLVNYACSRRGIIKDEVFAVNSKTIQHVIHKRILEKDMKLRGERISPYATLHGDSARDVKILSGDLIPLYEGHGKWDLFGSKKSYKVIPRKLVMKLLRCDQTSMVCEDEFDENERKVLEHMVWKKFLKKQKIAGKTHYFGLNEKTRRYFSRILRQRSNKNSYPTN